MAGARGRLRASGGSNFFDATLNGDPQAFARLDPAVVTGFDADAIVYQAK